jgi:hypothetical protein
MQLFRSLPLILSWALCGVSLVLVGFKFGSEQWRGYHILALGPMSLTYGTVAWLANPCLLIATVLWKRPRAPIAAAVGGMCLALSSFTFRGLPNDGEWIQIDAWGWGYYLWLSAFAMLLVAVLLRSNNSSQRDRVR